MSRNRTSKRRIILAVVIALIAILLFWLLLRFVFDRTDLDEQFGDTGDWGGDDIEETYIGIGDKEYVSLDDLDTYLLIGTDGGGENLGEALQGDLADFLMLLVVDNTTEKFAFYTIDRNSMVDMEISDETGEYTSYATQQICLSHWYGENEDLRNQNTVNSVSALLGDLEIDNYFTINMEDIGRVNNAIGGVEVTIDTDMTAVDPAFEEGATIVLDDKQAEEFTRARMALADDSNAARMARQEQYLEHAYAKIIGQFRENPEYINEMFDLLEDCIESDGSSKEVSVAVNHMMQYENQGFIKFSGETKKNDTLGDGVEHEEFYPEDDSILEGLMKVINFRESEDE